MRQFLCNIFTGRDNKTFDLGRLAWALSVLWFAALSTYHVVTSEAFDPMALGTGMATILAAGGAALALKQKDEPDAEG